MIRRFASLRPFASLPTSTKVYYACPWAVQRLTNEDVSPYECVSVSTAIDPYACQSVTTTTAPYECVSTV